MEIVQLTTNDLDDSTKAQLLELWNNEYPENLCYASIADFDTYLNKLNHTCHFLLLNQTNTICGWAFSFDRESERWFGIIVAEAFQGKGFGTALLKHMCSFETTLNGWVTDTDKFLKLNKQTYKSPLAFYLKHNFVLVPDVRLETEVLSAVKIVWRRLSNLGIE
ncbi:MAG: hypothetical protein RL660_2655 [Bacteroidota bacterium]|jgi:GNAT superfamily N-acetyltransferase